MATMLNLSKIPPEELAQMPARVPPPGIVPNLVDPYSIGNYIVTATSILMSIMMVFMALRFYVVFTIKKKMAPDDWAVVAGSIGCCYYFVVTCISIKVMKYGIHMWDLSILDVWSRDAAIIGFMANSPGHIIWPCIKTTFFLMYLQLFHSLTWLRCCVYIGLVVVWAFYIAVGLAQLAITVPPPGYGWFESFALPGYMRTFKLCVPTASFSLASDVYILVLPMLAVSHLRLSTANKIGVAAMFSTGFICCVASSLSVYFQLRITQNQNDFLYHVVFVFLTYILEMCVGISASCMPSLALLHKHKTGINVNAMLSAFGSHFRRRESADTSSPPEATRTIVERRARRSLYPFLENCSLYESQSVGGCDDESNLSSLPNSHDGRF